MIIDTDGFAIPWTTDDAVIESELLDPEAGPPESWMSWTDADYWQLGPEPEPFQPTAVDLAQFAAWCQMVEEELDEISNREETRRLLDLADIQAEESRISDDDLRAAGLPVG
jgi:hypothetical protein